MSDFDPNLLDRVSRWRHDAALWVREDLKAHPDNWQQDVLDAYSGKTTDKQRLAMMACKGPGKTATEAWCGLHFLAFYPDCKIAATAITGDNLRDNLWTEFRKWMRRSSFMDKYFNWSKERIVNKERPEEWWISARKWSKDADPEQQANTLAGLHADYLLFILDEAGGIPDSVAAAAEGGLATGKVTKLLIGGNPTHASGPLYRACTSEKDLWYVVRITGDPDDPNRAPRVSIKWAREQIQKYGRQSAYVMVNVLGLFPAGAIDTVLSIEECQEASERWGLVTLAEPRRILGVDIARYGNDLTVICVREGDRIVKWVEWQGKSTTVSAQKIREIYHELDCDEIRVDDIGVGGGVTDQLEDWGLPVIPINVGEKAISDPDAHVNLRSELYADFQEMFVNRRIQLCPETIEDTSFVQEASSLKVQYNDRNKRRIEPKGDYRKRTGRSPNYLDAGVLAFADRAAKKSWAIGGTERIMSRGTFSPYKGTTGPRKTKEPRTRVRVRLIDRRDR